MARTTEQLRWEHLVSLGFRDKADMVVVLTMHGFLTFEAYVSYDGFEQIGGHIIWRGENKAVTVTRWLEPWDCLGDFLSQAKVELSRDKVKALKEELKQCITSARTTPSFSTMFCDFQVLIIRQNKHATLFYIRA
jgi:hypothetical protein